MKKKTTLLRTIILIAVAIIGGFSIWFLSGGMRAKAGLQVETGGLATNIYLNGEKIGTSPLLNQELASGQYTLLLQPSNTQYASYQREINLEENFLSVIIWEPGMSVEESEGIFIEPKKISESAGKENESWLNITSSPDKILVKIDDGEALVTPQKKLSVESEKNYELSFSLPSYENREQKIQVVANEEINIFVKLAKKEGDSGEND